MSNVLQYQACSQFLASLLNIGMSMTYLREVVEEAYWKLLVNPAITKWEDTSPYGLHGGPALEIIAQALPDLATKDDLSDAAQLEMMNLIYWASARQHDASPAAQKARKLSVASAFRVGVFMALAFRAGVYESKRAVLRGLVMEVLR